MRIGQMRVGQGVRSKTSNIESAHEHDENATAAATTLPSGFKCNNIRGSGIRRHDSYANQGSGVTIALGVL
jgi:hypothetical protein